MNKSLQKKTRLLQIINFTFLFFISLNVNDVIGQTQPTMAVRGTINSFGNSAMTYRAGLNQTWIATVQATTTNATAGFLYANNGSFNPKWARGASVTFNTQTDWFADGGDGTYNQTNGRFYTFIIRDVASGSNTRGYVFETSAAPVSVSSVTQSPIAGSVATGNAVTITATTSANLPTGQGVFLRYSTNNFTSSTILNMTGSASTYTATIPATANTLGANVVYYVFTSGGTTPMAVADADFSTINLNNNSGSNYNYTVVAPSTYTWNQTGTASWATDTNWSPTRTTPNTADILQFNNGATTTVTNIPIQTVGGILVSANTTVNLQPAAAGALTISNGVTGADLSIASGSALNANGASALALTLATGATGSISGTMNFTTSANTLVSSDASGITFNNGSSFTQGTGNTGNVFGSGTSNSIVFASGSTFNHNAGSNPFQKAQPASVVVFQTGSNYVHNIGAGSGLAFSGRTYSNLTLSGGGLATLTGASAVYMDNLTVSNSTTFSIGMTGVAAAISSINGNINVATGSTFNANGTGASLQFNGNSQTLSGAGAYTIATGQTINIPSGRVTALQSNMTITGTGSLAISGTIDLAPSVVVSGTGVFNLAAAATLRTGHIAGLASSGATGSVQTTTRTLPTTSNYVYNGTANQITGTGLPATVNTLTINNTGTSPNNIVTLSAITAITATSGSLTLTAGQLDLNAKQLTIPTNGNMVATAGDFTATAGPVFFVGAGSVSGTVNFPTVTIAGGVNFGSASNIVTSLQLNSGAFINTNAPTYGSASTLIYNTTGTYGRNLEWSATSGKGYPNHVQIQNGTTLDLAANGFADRAIAGNLNLGLDGSPSAGSLTMGATTNKLTVGGNVVIGGNTSGTSVLTLSSAIGGDIYLSGNWDTKTNGSYASNSRAVFFQGAGTSTVTTIGAATFDFLFINKTSGGIVSLANDMTVNNNLTLNAQLVTNAFKVIIPTGNNVTANVNGWVRGNLQKNIPTGTNSRTFEVGNGTVYTPITTAYSGVTGAGNLVVSTTDNDHPQIGSSTLVATKTVNRFYSIANSGVTGGSYDATFTFVAGDVDSGVSTSVLGIANYVNPTWTNLTIGARTSTTTQATGVTVYGDFQLGEGQTTWTAGASTTAWATSGNWSNGLPTLQSNVFIASASFYPVISSDVSINSLTINSTTSVIVNSGFDLTVTNAIVNNGTLTIENNANLLQTTNDTNTGSGSTIVKRNSSLLKRLDYTLWSSPVTGQGLYAFSKFTLPNRFYVYDTATDIYNNSVGFNLTGLQYPSPLVSPNGVDGTDNANVQFTNGIGYLIRVPYNHPTAPTVYNGIFTGVANNGPIFATVSTALNGFNAVGNPYPSRLNVHNFIDGNTNITGPLYLWRKTNTTAVSSSYATLTKTAYVANGSAGGDTGTGFFPTGGGQEQDWVLNIGQGFIVKATSGSTISFTNSMRRSSNANQFFRNSQTTTSTNNGLYWLNLIDNTGVYSQMAVGYSSEGTIADDRGIDGENINKEFYLTSLIGAGEYSIQGRPEFDPSDVVPLSYKALTSGNYSIAIDHADGLFTNTNQAIYLKDNLTASEHNLQTGAYNFTSVAGTFTNRFEIIYQSQLSIENPTFNANQVIVYKNGVNDFVINSGTTIMASVKVFDIRGRLLLERNNINASQTTMTVGMANEVLLVQITSEDGVVVTKKVVR